MGWVAESLANVMGQILYFGFEILALIRGRFAKYREISAERRAALSYWRARRLERTKRLRQAYEMANKGFAILRAADQNTTYLKMGYLIAMRLDTLARQLGIPGGAQKEIKEVIKVLRPIQAELNYPSSLAVAIADLESRLSPTDRSDYPTHGRTTQSIARSGVSIVNKSNCTVYFRPDGSDEAIPLEPGGTYGSIQIGMALPETRPGKVFKSLSYLDITIDENGVLVPEGGMVFRALNLAQGGGWKDRSWLAARHETGEHGWDSLFAASEREPECMATPTAKRANDR